MPAKIIAFANQKGGVGKSTSVVNIAASLGILGKRILVCDCDPQGNTTSGFGISKRNLSRSVYDVLIGRSEISPCIVETPFSGVSVLPANISLAGAEFELVTAENRETRLKTALAPVLASYDFVIIDCPPSLGILTINALTAADGLIVPMQCEYYSLEGLSQLMISVKQIKQRYNRSLTLVGILITMYNGRLNLSVQVLDEVKKYYPGKVFTTAIARSVRLSEAPSYGQPVYYYDRSGRGTEQYMEAAKELLQKI